MPNAMDDLRSLVGDISTEPLDCELSLDGESVVTPRVGDDGSDTAAFTEAASLGDGAGLTCSGVGISVSGSDSLTCRTGGACTW